MRKDNYQMVIRFNPDEKKKLDYLLQVYNVPMADLIKGYISVDYDNLQGQPELKKALEDMERIKELLAPYQK